MDTPDVTLKPKEEEDDVLTSEELK